jgi:CHAT domain-containing protein
MKGSKVNKYFAVTALLGLVLALVLSGGSITTASNLRNVETPQSDSSTSLSRGRALLKQGHADQALPLLESALTAFTSTNNARGIAAAQDALGDLYMIQGQYKVALEHYKSAYQSFVVASGKDQTSANVANNVAGRAGSTASAATDTAATASLDNGYNANLMLAKIGDTNYRMGQMSEASTAYFQMNVSKPESAAAKTTRRLGGLGGIGGILTTGRPSVEAPVSGAIGLLETTKEIQEYRKSIVYMTFELGLGRIAFANKDLEAARKHFQNALDAGSGALPVIAKAGQTRRFKAAARTSLGDVALREGRYKDAVKMFNDAADGAKKDERLDLMWPAQRGLGRSLWLQAAQEKDSAKMREQALNAYRDALKTIETIREGSLRADESRTTFLATTEDVYDEASSAFAEMALMNAGGNATVSGKALDYAAESFRIAEAGRARSLLDMLGEVNAQITEGVPPDLLKKKQDNLDRQQQIAEQLTGIALAGDQKKPSDLESELDKLQTEFDQIENQIRTASPKYAALTANQPLTLADVQQKVLDDNTVLLEYQLGADNSYLFAATKSAVSLYKLPRRADIDKLATDFRAQLIPPKLQRRIVGIDVAADEQRGLGIVQGPSEDLPPFVAASNALYKAVVEPAASVIGDKRILVVADGALNYIPFEALVKNSDGADYASLNYLVKTNEVVYSPSASVIAAIRQGSASSTGKSMLLVADPVFSADDPRAKGGATASSSGETRGLGLGLESAVNDVAGENPSTGGPFRLARLAGTRTEADAISAIAKTGGGQADLWTDLNANEDNVKSRDLSSYRYVHVATHGLLDADRPQFTGVVLSLVGNKSNDGFFRTDEIFNLKLGSPLVMLSACETGLGKEKRGEGVIGLTRAFMYAGAPTVGVSLWSVADKSTADLMTDFYKRLLGATAQPPGAAMREAQLAMINGKKYSAPFYWAPFVLVGEWR